MKHRASNGYYSFDLVIHRHGVWAMVATTINLITEKDEEAEAEVVVDSCSDIAGVTTMAAAILSVFFTSQLSQLAQS